MQGIYRRFTGIALVLLVSLFVSGCIFPKATKYGITCVDKVDHVCYVKKGQDPCEKCDNISCEGRGKK